MSKIFLLIFLVITTSFCNAQILPAKTGVIYGVVSAGDNVVPVNNLEKSLKENKYEGKISGKVVEVCQAEGCWIKLEKKDGATMMVRAKDHKFVMPADIAGKEVVVDGVAEVKEVSESQRRHYAEDAGQSAKQVKKIKGSEKQIVFMASGVQVK
ncbi:MAG TPA: DUF4920 domain-containing protein [Chitinophagaceae bacterium]|jgi:hypothetical protein